MENFAEDCCYSTAYCLLSFMVSHDVPGVRIAFKLEMRKAMVQVDWDQKGGNWLRKKINKKK